MLVDYGKLKEPLGLEIFTLTAVLEFIGIILLMSSLAEASGIHSATGALLLCMLFSQMPKKDYEDTVEGLHSMAYGFFIPIFFAGFGIYSSFGFVSQPNFLIAGVVAVITVGKFGGTILAALVAKLSLSSRQG